MFQKFHIGDYVRIIGVPSSIASLPEESRLIFSRAVDRILRIDDIAQDTGELMLNLKENGSQSQSWCDHTIWLEPEFAKHVDFHS